MPLCVCRAKSFVPAASWSTACSVGIGTRRFSSACWTCCGVETHFCEVGVRMLRSPTAPRATRAEKRVSHANVTIGTSLAAHQGAERGRYAVTDQGSKVLLAPESSLV